VSRDRDTGSQHLPAFLCLLFLLRRTA
jgi:hypothetical protein